MPSRRCTVTVDLDPEQAAFVDRLVKAGTHPDAAAVVRAALAEYGAAGEDEAAGLEYEQPAETAPPQDVVATDVLGAMLRRADADLARGAYTELRSESELDAFMNGLLAEATARAHRKRVAGRRA
ncbi:hypothetical protein [Caenispirillum bisanense]|uniref:hypothetical protein n=1 Tax=Caenispirillum bisanense TaxID=414052 RepID=UPI0031E38C5B